MSFLYTCGIYFYAKDKQIGSFKWNDVSEDDYFNNLNSMNRIKNYMNEKLITSKADKVYIHYVNHVDIDDGFTLIYER